MFVIIPTSIMVISCSAYVSLNRKNMFKDQRKIIIVSLSTFPMQLYTKSKRFHHIYYNMCIYYCDAYVFPILYTLVQQISKRKKILTQVPQLFYFIHWFLSCLCI